MLALMEEAHEEIDWNVLITNLNAEEIVYQKTKLIKGSLTEYYLVCVGLIENISCTTEHDLAVCVIKDWKTCDSLQIVATTVDNKNRETAQKQDADNVSNDNAGNEIFNLFPENHAVLSSPSFI